jgi:hypothetical protein
MKKLQFLGHFDIKIYVPKSAHIHLIFSQCICLKVIFTFFTIKLTYFCRLVFFLRKL